MRTFAICVVGFGLLVGLLAPGADQTAQDGSDGSENAAVVAGGPRGYPGMAPEPARASKRAGGAQGGRSGGTVTIPRSSDGHYYVDAKLNGRALRTLVDTGASSVALNRDDARRVGIHVTDGNFTGVGMTAGGRVPVAHVRIARIEVNGIVATDVAGVIIDSPGMPPLLGQSFLGRLDQVSISNDRMVMR
jgi:aspartyl protease family protein